MPGHAPRRSRHGGDGAGLRAEILVDSAEIWPRIREDLRRARGRVLVQTLSFEGDAAGTSLAAELERSPAADRRLLVDTFTRLMINDRFLLSPRAWADGPLMEERRRTVELVASLGRAGVGVRFTNPAGPLLVRFPARNHKKLVAIDDTISYVGGLNFSDHNFAWHDLMLRVEDPAVTRFLVADFDATWAGATAPREGRFDGLDIHLLDGSDNESGFAPVLRLIEGSRRSIFLESPYVTFPFLDALLGASRRGVEVTLVVPESNNWSWFEHAFGAALAGSQVRLLLYPGRLTHLKALLVDDTALVLGSSNFDYLSYTLHHETVVIVTDAATIRDFRRRVVEPDVAISRTSTPRGDRWRAALLRAELRALAWAVRLAGRGPVSEPALSSTGRSR